MDSSTELQNELVAAYVDALKAAYVQVRRKWRPDFVHLSNNYDHNFRVIAEILSKHNLDPYQYVRFVEQYITQFQPDIYVNQVTSISLATDFIKCKPEIDDLIKLQVRLNAEKLSDRLNSGFTLEQALNDKYNDFTPAFSFAMAYSKQKYELAETFKESAKKQLMFEPVLKEILGEWLPGDLL